MARIITIARGMGSGGRTIGKMLSEQLGIKYYDNNDQYRFKDLSPLLLNTDHCK